jgi:hypothetical protein
MTRRKTKQRHAKQNKRDRRRERLRESKGQLMEALRGLGDALELERLRRADLADQLKRLESA